MPGYPYGMQGSPAVGNGLGGLPRRSTTVVAATSSGLAINTTNALATTSAITNSTTGSGNLFGMGMEFTPGVFCAPIAYYDGTQYQTVLGYLRASLTGCSLITTSSVDTGYQATTSCGPGTYWKGTNGTTLYWLYNNNLYSVGSSGTRSVLVSSLFSSGTLNSGSSSGSTWTLPSFYTQHFPDSAYSMAGTRAYYVDAGNGTGVGVIPINMSGTVRLGVFVTDSSGTFTQSFAVGSMSSTTVVNYYMVVRKIGATTYSVFFVGNATGGTLYTMSLTFDTSTSTGSVVKSWGPSGTAASQNSTNDCTSFTTSSSLQIVFYDGTYTNTITFPCSDTSTPVAGTVTHLPVSTAQQPTTYKVYDPTFNDYWYNTSITVSSSVGYGEPIPITTGPGVKGIVSYSTPVRTIVDLGGSTNTIAFPNIGTVFAAINSDPSPTTAGPPYVFRTWPYRLNQTSWVAFMEDQTSSGYSSYGQVFKVL